MNNQALKIACANVNGLHLRVDEVNRYIKSNDFDIFMFTETHLARGQQYVGRPNGYLFYRVDHPSDSCRGGVGLLIKKSIMHTHDPKLNVSTESFQLVGVSVKTNIGEFYIGSVYCPPNVKETKSDLFTEFFRKLPQRFILSGDWNSKHRSFGCRADNPRGGHLLTSLKNVGASTISDGFPTYYPTDPNKQPDLLDFFVIRNVSRNYLAVGSEIELNSDHIPIKLALHHKIILKKRNQITNNRTNWDKFRELVNKKVTLDPIDNIEKLEREAGDIAEIIVSAASDSSPTIKYTNSGVSLPPDLCELIKERRRLRAKWQKSRHYLDKIYFNRVNKITTNRISELRQEQTYNFLKELTPTPTTDYSLWKTTKYLKKTDSFSEPLRSTLVPGGWTRSHEEKANEFSRHLSEVFQPNKDILSDLDIKAEQANIIPSPEEEFPKVRRSEVADLIRYKIQAKKAPGMDLVSGEMLKNLPNVALKKLADIYDASLRLCWIPTVWKRAEVVMIHKKHKPRELASSYRPISLLSIIGKLFERIFLKRLMPMVDERKILPRHQFGFRKRHSTIEQVHRTTDLIENCFENKLICSLVLLDISQAFDRVFLEGLAFKLLKLLPINYYLLLTSYLSGRSFRVRHEDTYSDFAPILAGVPQGSVLGPVLFLIYMHDLPRSRGIRTSTYADDTGLAAIGEEPGYVNAVLQRGLDRTSKFCKRWRTALNGTKSQHATFSLNKNSYSPVKIDGEVVPPVDAANHLGVWLDTRLTFGHHIRVKSSQIKKKYRSMWWLFKPNNGLSLKNKLLLYSSILKPIWTYGCQLWGCAASSNIRKIQSVQSSILRGILGVRWDDYVRNDVIHRLLGVPTVVETIQKHSLSYARRLSAHPNPSAFKLIDRYNAGLRRLKRRKPFDCVSEEIADLLN